MQMKILVHKSLLVSFFSRSFLFFFHVELVWTIDATAPKCISVQMTDYWQRNELILVGLGDLGRFLWVNPGWAG
jgi:hypothetical protein